MPTGYLIPVPVYVSPKSTVVAHAADATLAAADMGKNHTNTGAGGAVNLTLPAAAVSGGCAFRVQLTVAQAVNVVPVTGEKVFLGGSGVASKYAAIAGVIGNFMDVACDGVDWFVVNYSGVATKQP